MKENPCCTKKIKMKKIGKNPRQFVENVMKNIFFLVVFKNMKNLLSCYRANIDGKRRFEKNAFKVLK